MIDKQYTSNARMNSENRYVRLVIGYKVLNNMVTQKVRKLYLF